MKSKRILAIPLFILYAIVLYFNFYDAKKDHQHKEPNLVKIDTIWRTKVDTFKVETTKYKKVYVYKKSPTTIVRDTTKVDKNVAESARLYIDTLKNADIEIYSRNLVRGSLEKSVINYKLKVPKKIVVTKVLEPPKKEPSGLYLFSEIGGNKSRFDNISFGVQYNNKTEWFVSYRLNIAPMTHPTHNIGVGYKLF